MLDRPIERGVKQEFERLIIKQKRAPFLNFLGHWQYDQKKFDFMVNNSSTEGVRLSRQSKKPLFTYYDTSRQAHGDVSKLNLYI